MVSITCTVAWFATTSIMDHFQEWSRIEMEHHVAKSELAFKDGTYRIVWMPNATFDSIFGPSVTLILAEDGDNLMGPDLYMTDDGWLIKSMEIVESPDLSINLTNLKTWTWTCPHRWGSYSDGGMCIANERWEGEDSWHGAWVHRVAYTTKAEAHAAADKHNKQTGHRAKVFDLLNGKPIG